MSTLTFSIPLGSVNLDKLETDGDYRREAHRLVPEALKQIGERTAEIAWNELQKGLRGVSGLKVNSSSSDKSLFVREGGKNYGRDASSQHRREVENHIIKQLREMKRKKV